MYYIAMNANVIIDSEVWCCDVWYFVIDMACVSLACVPMLLMICVRVWLLEAGLI